MGIRQTICFKFFIIAIFAVCFSVPVSAAEKPLPPEDNDATYQLPMYIPKIIQQKTVKFDDDSGFEDNDEMYLMPEAAPKAAPAAKVAPEDNDNYYKLPGDYSPTRNKIKPKPVVPPKPQVVPQPQPQQQYQQPQPQYQQPQQQYQQPQYQQPAPQPYYQQYDYYDQNDNVAPSSSQENNYPSYYQ